MPPHVPGSTLDPVERDRFAALASEWWDTGGKFRPLHQIGPARLSFLRDELVAGDVNRAADARRDVRMMELAAKAASSTAASHDFASEGFFEYHLYTLDGRTTIKDNQTKQLSLLSASEVPVAKELIYYGAAEYYRNAYGVPVSNQKIAVYLDVKNSKENRLGLPLPKGKVRVYKADRSGSQQFIGEDWIDHTPKDEKVKIKMGNAFDLVGERTQKEFRKLGASLYEVEWEISLRNHKDTPQTVTVIEPSVL